MMARGRKTSAADTRVMPEETVAPAYPTKGFRIGEYVIEDVLGHGSMATVFQAIDSTGHEVALKIFQEGPGVSATMLERFRREAEASKKLRRHPHIITIYATGKEGQYHYIAMESIKRSKTFEAALESMPMSLNGIVEIIIKIARALQYAHSRRIVHRDVKPTNIMIDEFGEPLLSDFGVAELIDWPSCTLTGALTGTPLYMSPEQARGERVGPPSDIYSLGVVLYEAVTGVLPYNAQHRSQVKEVLEAVKNEPPRRPRLFRKEITPDLEAVMLKALEKAPGDRYPDAEAFALDLERALAGKKVSAHHFSFTDQLRHQFRLHKQTLAAASFALMLGVGFNVFFSRKLVTARFEGLLYRAQRRDAYYALARVENGRNLTHDIPQGWNEIRRARRAMMSGDWAGARALLDSAVELSDAVGDKRTVAIAQLGMARCETILGNRSAARSIYAGILGNPDASQLLVGMAELEYLLLALLEDDEEAAVQILVERRIPPHGYLASAVECLAGDLGAEHLLERIPHMPNNFRNDAYLIAAIRYYRDDELRKCSRTLRRCVTASSPSTEWPAPFARELQKSLLR